MRRDPLDPRLFDSDSASEPAPPGDGSAVVVTTTKPRKARQKATREVPRYHVILWDSVDHSFEYVERMLRELFGHTAEECKRMAKEVDSAGKVVVLTTTREHAELKQEQIHAYGPDALQASCKGAMSATVESAG
ncbi:MAG: ATP-dependent Clp protease adaptor ClpS [Lacipirellulaceae bacterium]